MNQHVIATYKVPTDRVPNSIIVVNTVWSLNELNDRMCSICGISHASTKDVVDILEVLAIDNELNYEVYSEEVII